MSKALAVLRARGLLAAVTHENTGALLDPLLSASSASVGSSSSSSSSSASAPPSVYCGFDPTAESLHVGNLLTAIALRHFQMAGMRPLLLVGGATGMIGDPSGKSEERRLLNDDVVAHNANQIMRGLANVVDFECPKVGAVVCNNADWYASYSVVHWIRDVGKHFRVNAMLQRESVKKRLQTDQGISFLEFSYQLFQAYDFLHLYRHYNCHVQIGGNDQWGNIASGCDLVRKSTGKDVFGVTLPLLTTSRGEKYGKSAGNAIWLDSTKTSVFDFYQFFLRSDDADVEQLLKSFTFLDLQAIREIVEEHKLAPEKRLAQRELADNVTRLLHGEKALATAHHATKILFDNNTHKLSADQVLNMTGDARRSRLTRSQVVDRPFIDVLVLSNACSSKAEGRRLIKGGGVYLNNERVTCDKFLLGSEMLLDERCLLIRIGKRNNFIVEIS